MVATVAGLHIAAALAEAQADRVAPARADELVPLGDFSDLAEGRARPVLAGNVQRVRWAKLAPSCLVWLAT